MSATVTEDLWPTDLSTFPAIESPLTILKVQGQALGKRTQNLVYGEVYGIQIGDSANLCWGFALRAPALGDYRFKLFDIRYDPSQLYPLVLDSQVEFRGAERKRVKVASPEELKDALKDIFKAERTRKAIDSILSQSK